MNAPKRAVRPIDRARTARLMLGLIEGDHVVVDVVMREALAEDPQPRGLRLLLFAVSEYAAALTLRAAPTSYRAELTQSIIGNVLDDAQRD